MPDISQMNYSHNSNYHTPASALYDNKEVIRSATNSSVGRISGTSSCPPHHQFCSLLIHRRRHVVDPNLLIITYTWAVGLSYNVEK